MPRTRKSYLMNMGRGLFKRMSLKRHKTRSRSPPSSRSPAVARGTYVHRRSSIRSPVQYRTSSQPKRTQKSMRRMGMNSDMIKRMMARQNKLTKTMKVPLGIKI